METFSTIWQAPFGVTEPVTDAEETALSALTVVARSKTHKISAQSRRIAAPPVDFKNSDNNFTTEKTKKQV
jgi:hypothetical protein